jgi:cytochrome c
MALAATALTLPLHAATKDAAAKIDASGKAADTETEFTVEGIIAARATLADGSVIAVLQEEGASLPVLLSKDTTVKPRDAVSLTGKLANHSLGLAVLGVTKETVSSSGRTLRPTPRSVEEFKDPSAFVAEYVVLTNVSFAATSPKFTAGQPVPVKNAAGAEARVFVGKSLDGREVPADALNLFGVPLKTTDGWVVLPARFVPAESSKVRALATKHTCMSCHQLDKKVVGPSYQEVATKYRNDGDLVAKITGQIENGGTGKWGAVPMAGFKGKIPADEVQKLAQWIADMRWDAVLGE